MDWSNVALTLLGIVIGILATTLISKYYFRKSVTKQVTPFIHLASSVLAGIDPVVREALKIHYGDVEVKELYQLQFLIANDGERAIRDCIEPFWVSPFRDR